MKLPIHDTPKMVADANSYSPSAGKPVQVMDSWADLGLPLDIVAPAPVSQIADFPQYEPISRNGRPAPRPRPPGPPATTRRPRRWA